MDFEREGFVGAGDVGEHDTGAGVEITGFHREDDRLGREVAGAHHDPTAEGIALPENELVVVVPIVDADAIHDVEFQFGEAAGENDIPHRIGAEAGGVAFVVHRRVAIVDLEEFLTVHLHQLLGGYAPDEVRVVEMEEHRLAGFLALREYGIDGAPHDLDGVIGGDRRDERNGIGQVHVHRTAHLGLGRGLRALPTRGDLHAGNHEEPAGFLDQGAIFGERLEAHGFFSVGLALFDPSGAEAGEVLFQHRPAAFLDDFTFYGRRRFQFQPARALGEYVVVGHCEEVIAGALVAVGDHLGIVVAVAPQRVRVEVALEPARSGGRRFRGGGGGRRQDEDGGEESGVG